MILHWPRGLALCLALACGACATAGDEAPPAAKPEPAVAAATREAPSRPAAKPAPPKTEPAPAPKPSPEGAPAAKGADALAKGIAAYDDGDYRAAGRQLQSALDLGLPKRDEAQARKYLAFIACTSNRPGACRDQFRKALDSDPSLELAPAEAGHPTWGPVWKKAKADAAARAKRR